MLQDIKHRHTRYTKVQRAPDHGDVEFVFRLFVALESRQDRESERDDEVDGGDAQRQRHYIQYVQVILRKT